MSGWIQAAMQQNTIIAIFWEKVNFCNSSTVNCKWLYSLFQTSKEGKVFDSFSSHEVLLKWIFVLCVCLCSIRIIDHRDDANICIKHPTHMPCGISSAVPFYELFALWHLGNLGPICCYCKISLLKDTFLGCISMLNISSNYWKYHTSQAF